VEHFIYNGIVMRRHVNWSNSMLVSFQGRHLAVTESAISLSSTRDIAKRGCHN